MHEYRWDKRRAKKNTRAALLPFDIFDYILLILVFALGTVLFKLLNVHAALTASCAEAFANFGAGQNSLPAFKQIFIIAILIFVYWVTLLVLRWRKGAAYFIWQGFMFLCIWSLGMGAYHMSIWNSPNPPDGTLAVSRGVWVRRGDELTWRSDPLVPLLREFIPEHIKTRPIYYPNRRFEQCVWLDEGLIAVSNNLAIVDDYNAYVELVKSEDYRAPMYEIQRASHPLKGLPKFFFPRESYSEVSRANVQRRVLTSEERIRFAKKQACIKRAYAPQTTMPNAPHADIIEFCDPSEYPLLPQNFY